MNTRKTIAAGALCALALLTTAPRAGAQPLSDSDRAYAGLIAENGGKITKDLDRVAYVTSGYRPEGAWKVLYAAAAVQLHRDVERGLRLAPTPRFRGSKRLYDQALRDYDRSVFTLLPRAIDAQDQDGMMAAGRVMQDGTALLRRATTVSRGEMR